MAHTGVVMANLNMPLNCGSCCVQTVIDELQVRGNGSMSIGTAR